MFLPNSHDVNYGKFLHENFKKPALAASIHHVGDVLKLSIPTLSPKSYTSVRKGGTDNKPANVKRFPYQTNVITTPSYLLEHYKIWNDVLIQLSLSILKFIDWI